MPATERAFSEIPPARLYVDTNIVLSYLVESDALHPRSRPFFQHVMEIGLTTIYLSSLSWIEFAHVVRRDDFRGALPPDVQQQYELHRWDQQLVREAYLNGFLGMLNAFLSHFEVVEIPLDPEIRSRATQFMGTYNLDGQDAVHLASATGAGVLDLASFDKSFLRVDGLYLWDDKLFAAGEQPLL